jgi:HCOMODA/2-hydroxy-3-carboxy-muconic semialdehyde decarboxylase
MKEMVIGERVNRRCFLEAVVLAAAVALLSDRAIGGQQRPASAGPADPQLVEDLVAASRILAQEGVADSYGHVSARHDRDPNRFLLPRSLAPALVTAADLIEYDLDGNPINASGRAQYIERFIHSEIYKARPDVKAVVHAHPPSLISFGVSTVPLRPVFQMGGFIGEGIPIFDIRKAAGITNMLVSDSNRGRALAQALGNKPAVLMRGHGVAVVGPSLPFAVGRSVYLQQNAAIQLQAMSLGGTVTYLDPAEARQIMADGENRGYERPWDVWKKKALGR